MGVPGLWEFLRGTEESKSLTSLAWSQYFTAKDFERGMKVGIDVSIWLFQATSVAQHEVHNHALLILFFKLSHLVGLPIQFLFVFDGPGRPAFKRGKMINTSSKSGKGLEKSLKTMIELFGFEAWEAPGEAEAELGYLNNIGALDAVITEDVDALLFKANTVLVKPDKSAKTDNRRYNIFRSEDIAKKHRNINADALILVALLSGGDYDQGGLSGCGPKISFQLACENFGSALVNAYRNMKTESFLTDFLPAFRVELSDYLRTDPRGLLGRKMTKLAREFDNTPQLFDSRIIESYVNPLTSASNSVQIKWKNFKTTTGLKLGELGAFAGNAFGWGKEDVTRRFGNILADKWMEENLLMELRWPGTWVRGWEEVKAELSQQEAEETSLSVSITPEPYGSQRCSQEGLENTLEYPTITKITTYRKHRSTDELLEYRCLMEPARFFYETMIGIRDLPEPPPKSPSKRAILPDSSDEDDEYNVPSSQIISTPKDPNTPFLIWLPYKLIRHTHPDLVRDFNEREERKVVERHEKVKRAADKKAGSVVRNTDLVITPSVSEDRLASDSSQIRESPPDKSFSVATPISKSPRPIIPKASSSKTALNNRNRFMSSLSQPSSSVPGASSPTPTLGLSPRKMQRPLSTSLTPPILSPSKNVNASLEDFSQSTPRATSKVKKPISSIYIEIESPPSSASKSSSVKPKNAAPVSKHTPKISAFPIKLSKPRSMATAFDNLASDLLSSLPLTIPSSSQAPSPMPSSSPPIVETSTPESSGDISRSRTSTMSVQEIIEISDSDESDDESGLSYTTKIRKNALTSQHSASLQPVRFDGFDRLTSKQKDSKDQTGPLKCQEPKANASNLVAALEGSDQVIEILDSSDEERT